MKKYQLVKSDKVRVYGRTLFRIKASINFGIVKKGELGGYIEKTDNLDDEGNAWVSGDARVYGDAWVSGDAWVYGDARVYGNAWVYGDAQVYGNARVSGDARVYGDAWVYGNERAETGYWFAHHRKDANITGREMPDGYVTLVEDYKEPESESESPPREIEIKGAKYRLVE